MFNPSNFWGSLHRRGGVCVARGGVSNFNTPPPLPGTPPLRGVGSRTSQRDNKISAGPLRSLRLCVRIIMPHGCAKPISAISAISAGKLKTRFLCD